LKAFGGILGGGNGGKHYVELLPTAGVSRTGPQTGFTARVRKDNGARGIRVIIGP